MANELDLDGPLTQEVMKRAISSGGNTPPQEGTEGIGKLAPLMWLGGGAADIASTIHGFQNGMQEANPMVNWAPKGAQIPLGIGMELGGVLLAKKLLGDKHPNILKAIMMGLGGVHGGLAMKNIAATKSANNSGDPARPDIPPPAVTEYMNPDYFGK